MNTMNRTNRPVPSAAAAPVLALAGAALAFAQSGAAGAQPEDPAETFAGYQLAGYGYDKHFCWPLDGTPQAQAEELAAAAGGTQTPVYTFELRTEHHWDMCLWPADANWEAARNDYGDCAFFRKNHDSAWNGVIYGEADGAEYIYGGDSHTGGPRDETIVYAGAIAGKMVCVDSTTYHEPASADLLLFEGDTRSGEADQTDAGAETG